MPAARDWVDYATLGLLALSAAGTLAAVVVALFGERLRARRTRPVLTLSGSEERIYEFQPGSQDDADGGLWIEIANADGRETARDVEIYVSTMDVSANLNLGGVLDGTPGAPALQLPGGIRRRIPLCNLGSPHALLRRRAPSDVFDRDAERTLGPLLEQTHALLSLWPASRGNLFWVSDGFPMAVELTVTASNAPTARYAGTFSIETVPFPEDVSPVPGLLIAIARWEEPLTRVPER